MGLKNFLLKNYSNKQSLIKNTFWLWLGQIASQLIRMLVIIYSARALGSAGYGAFAYALSLAGFFIVFSDIGINTILTRDSAEHPQQRKQYIATVFIIKQILVVFSFLLLLIIGSGINKIPSSREILPLVALIFAFDALKDFGVALTRSLEKMEIEALVSVLGSIVLAGLTFFLLSLSPTPEHLAYAYLLSSAFSFLIILIPQQKYFRETFKNFRLKLIRPILGSSLALAFSSLFGSIVIYADTIILGWFASVQNIGFYNAAQRPIQFLYLVSGIIASAVLPVMARLAKNNSPELKKIIEKTLALIMLAGLPIVAGGALLSQPIILFLFGAEYSASGLIFKILIFTLLFIYPAHLLTNLIIVFNRQKEIIKYWLFSALVIILASLIFIPKWGIIGAALAALLSRAIGNGLGFFQAKKIKSFHFFSPLKKIALATLFMSLLILLLLSASWPLAAIIILGAIFYFSVLALLKEPLLKEIVLFWKA